MELDQFLNQIDLKSDIFAITVCVVALLLILLVNRKRLGIAFREWRIQRSLKRIGSEQIRNLVCPDGLDGYYSIDRLALTDNEILLICYKPYGGNIYCADRISEWTQVVGRKSFKFKNPLFDLENQITSLRLITGKVPLRGYLFFNHSADFPKGHPDSVIHPRNIPEQILSTHCGQARPEIQAAWDLLKTLKQDAAGNGRMGVKT